MRKSVGDLLYTKKATKEIEIVKLELGGGSTGSLISKYSQIW